MEDTCSMLAIRSQQKGTFEMQEINYLTDAFLTTICSNTKTGMILNGILHNFTGKSFHHLVVFHALYKRRELTRKFNIKSRIWSD